MRHPGLRLLLWSFAVPLALGLWGCSPTPVCSDRAPTVLDGGTRRYLLASTGAQLVPQSPIAFQLTPANLAQDVDVFSIHNDFYGIPWDAFADGTPLPAPWVAQMQSLAAGAAAAGKPVFLTLALLSGDRQHLADRAVVTDGGLTTVSGWSALCYDFGTDPDGPRLENAYLRYLDWMVALFHPLYLNVAVEMNGYTTCGPAWTSLVKVVNDAYDEAHAVEPGVIAFPSFILSRVYGLDSATCPKGTDPQTCYDTAYAQLAGIKRDRFAISTYPYLTGMDKPSQIPADWFTRAGDRGGERTVIAETGWNSEGMTGRIGVLGICDTVHPSSVVDERDYLADLLDTAQAHNIDLVTWWSNRDLIPQQLMTQCPCTFNADFCNTELAFREAGGSDPFKQFFDELLLKVWGTMGVRRYDGTPKACVKSYWDQARALMPAPTF